MTPEEKRDEGQAARAAIDRFLGPAFDLVEAAYVERLAEIAGSEPWAADKLRAVATALRVTREVRAHVDGVAAGGRAAQVTLDHHRKIEAMSPERRRILGL